MQGARIRDFQSSLGFFYFSFGNRVKQRVHPNSACFGLTQKKV